MINPWTLDPKTLPRIGIEDRKRLPHERGVYFVFDESNTLLYIGLSKSVRDRIKIHVNKKTLLPAGRMFSVAWIECCWWMSIFAEKELIRRFIPPKNNCVEARKAKGLPSLAHMRSMATTRADPRGIRQTRS